MLIYDCRMVECIFVYGRIHSRTVLYEIIHERMHVLCDDAWSCTFMYEFVWNPI